MVFCLVFARTLINDFDSYMIQQVLVSAVNLDIQKLLFRCYFKIIFSQKLKAVCSQGKIVSCVVFRYVTLLTGKVVLPAHIFNLSEVSAGPNCTADWCNNIRFKPYYLLASLLRC